MSSSSPELSFPRCRRITAALLAVLLAWPPTALPEDITINFRDAEVRKIIEIVGELTGRNFMVDPRVRGKFTIIANKPVPEEALYEVMLMVLRQNGLRAVEEEYMTRILPANVATRFKPEFFEGEPVGDSNALVTTILSIDYLNAASVIPMIKPLMNPEAQVLLHKPTNLLMITEIKSNLERVHKILDRIDVPDIGDFEIIKLEHASAKEIVGLVQRASNKELRHLAQVIADNSGNRIILTGPEKVRVGLRLLIAELDTRTSKSASGRIKVINLHYARAEDVVSVVKGLLSSTEFIKSLSGEGLVIGGVAPKEAPAKKPAAGKAAEKKDTGKEEKKISLSGGVTGKRNYVIEVDKALNALIVGGPPKVIAAIETVVREIDVPRPQVLIEAIFADVTETKAFNLGARLEAGAEASGSGIGEGTDPQHFIGAVFQTFGTGSNASLNFLAGASGSVSNNPILLLVSALRTDGDSRVLSTPSILTMNNEEAMIDVSEVLSIRVGELTGETESTSFERQEFGTKLKVTPQITRGDAVRLDIEYKTEEVLATSRGSGTDPDSRKREIHTTVLVNDGDILVLGGLTNESASEDETRVPVLSRAPVLGHLFRQRSSNRNKTTLMIFIRPTILRNAEEGIKESRERYAELRLEQIMDAQAADTLLPDEDAMVLPELPLEDADEMRVAPRKKKIIKRKKIRRRDGG